MKPTFVYFKMYCIKACATLVIAGLSAITSVSAQRSETTKEQFKKDIRYLSSDELQGREVGTESERKAADYLVSRFKEIGVTAAGDSGGYFQDFSFNERPKLSKDNNYLQIGRNKYELGKDYFPVSYSADGNVLGKVSKALYGIIAPDKDYDDTDGRDIKGRVVAISVSSPDGIHPHSEYLDYHDLQGRVANLSEKGATAVILYNDDETAEDPKSKLSEFVSVAPIPVVFLQVDFLEEVLIDNNPVVLKVSIDRPEKSARNVLGLLDHGASQTVVIGAHYDHLGLGEYGGSLFAGEGEIHNGADDNASGVAMMLNLATEIKQRRNLQNRNYLFIGFTGEERGLYGSNHFTNHPTVDLDSVSYMLNFDMVGRLDSSMVLGINGVGTSPSWGFIEDMDASPLVIKTTESGIGPSDHASFYKRGVPAIHFFSGTHSDYHKPSDDEHLINYKGMRLINDLVIKVMEQLVDEKPVFTTTAENKGMGSMSFSVTLGVIPDYLFEGNGMRIDGVSDGKPASGAGLVTGDVVIALGEFEVRDMMSYMDALGKFKKGDKTVVTVKRGEEEVRSEIQF